MKNVSPNTFQECLSLHNVDLLKKFARILGFTAYGRKNEIIRDILNELSRDNLKKTVAKLDDLQKSALAEAVWDCNHEIDWNLFKNKYGRLPTFYHGWCGDTDWTLLDLFIFQNTVPPDIIDPLRQLLPQPAQAQIQTVPNLPHTLSREETVFDSETEKQISQTYEVPLRVVYTIPDALHDIKAVLRLVESKNLIVGDKTEIPGKATIKAMSNVLLHGDFYDDMPMNESSPKYLTEAGPIKAFAWPLIIQAAKLASPHSGKLRLTMAGRKALGLSPREILRNAWEKWRNSHFDEFSRVDAIKGQKSRRGRGGNVMTSLPARRDAITEALQECPVGQWIATDEFSRYMQAVGLHFDVTNNAWALYIEDRQYGSLGYQGFGDWNILQGRYIRAFLFEYAATMGCIDVAYYMPEGAQNDFQNNWGTDDLEFLSRYDGLEFFRINPLGAYILGLTEQYTPEEADPSRSIVKVLPNRDIVLESDRINPSDKLVIESMAIPTSKRTWKLDTGTALRSIERGDMAKGLRESLQSLCSVPLSDIIEDFFNELSEKGHNLSIKGMGLIIEAADSFTRELLVHNKALKHLCIPVGEQSLLVLLENEASFRQALLKSGYALQDH